MPGKISARSFGRAKKLSAAAVSVIFMLLLVIVPGPALSGARRGLSLCGETVIPSLFPFLVLSSFIIGSGLADACGRLFEPLTRRIFRLPGCAGAPIILGAIGGYPVGADAVAELCESGSLTKRDSERLLCFAVNSSPAFIIGAVGAGFLGSARTGMLLYIVHLAVSASIGLIMRPHTPSDTGNHRNTISNKPLTKRGRKSNGLSSAFVAAVTSSAESTIAISAFVILFSSLNSLMDYTGVTAGIAGIASRLLPAPAADPQFFNRAVAGILEVTNGCAAASGSCGMASVLLTAAILGFSGLSVQFQVISMIKNAGLSARLFILTRFLHAALSALFAFALFTVFPSAMPEAHSVAVISLNPGGLTVSFHSAPAVCAMLFLCALLLLSLVQI